MNDTTDRPIDRETLYGKVWAEPVSVVAPRYGLSDVGLAKICRSLAIPLPSRGYWAKVKAGKVMKRAPLPPLTKSTRAPLRLKKLSSEEQAAREEARRIAIDARKGLTEVTVPDDPGPPHPLVNAASKRLRRRDGWPEGSLVRSAPKEVLNVAVTRDALDRALQLADRLLKALATHGFDVEIDSGRGVTLLKSGETGSKMEFSLTEHVRRNRHEITPAEERARKLYHDRYLWNSAVPFPHVPQYDYHPTGKLTLQVGRWPSRTWNDTPRTQLENRLEEIIAGILVLASETHARELEQARQAEERRRAIERYEFLTRRRADETERFKQLEAEATNLERALRLRAYADAVEHRARSEGGLTAELDDWLHWARAKADWLDPLIQVSDPILDAPEPKRPGYW